MLAYSAGMLHRLAYLRRRLDTSIWLIPALFCLSSVILGLLMLWLDRHVAYLFTSWQMFAMPVESARQVLSVIAGSVISVGGVSFSVTMVALTLTSGQYGPKVVRHFLEDNDSKISLGLFLGAYVYALVVLTGYVEADHPHLSVLTALLLALLAVVGFVRFIHRIATDLQADEIVQRIGKRLCQTFDELIEAAQADARSHDLLAWRRQAARGTPPHEVAYLDHGYVQSIDYAGLVRWSRQHDCCLQVRVRAGDFIVEGNCAFKVFGCSPGEVEASVNDLNRHIITGPVRTSAQDAEFPITQLNQLAARALSPGINDPGTAISCVDSFCLAFAQIIDHDLPGNVFNDDQGTPRLLARMTGFEGLLKAVFVPLRQFAVRDVSVTISLYEVLCRLAELTTRHERLALLGMHGRLIGDDMDDESLGSYDRRDVRQRAKRLQILVHRFDR
jgi:uncharacterized membrane protein